MLIISENKPESISGEYQNANVIDLAYNGSIYLNSGS